MSDHKIRVYWQPEHGRVDKYRSSWLSAGILVICLQLAASESENERIVLDTCPSVNISTRLRTRSKVTKIGGKSNIMHWIPVTLCLLFESAVCRPPKCSA